MHGRVIKRFWSYTPTSSVEKESLVKKLFRNLEEGWSETVLLFLNISDQFKRYTQVKCETCFTPSIYLFLAKDFSLYGTTKTFYFFYFIKRFIDIFVTSITIASFNIDYLIDSEMGAALISLFELSIMNVEILPTTGDYQF